MNGCEEGVLERKKLFTYLGNYTNIKIHIACFVYSFVIFILINHHGFPSPDLFHTQEIAFIWPFTCKKTTCCQTE